MNSGKENCLWIFQEKIMHGIDWKRLRTKYGNVWVF